MRRFEGAERWLPVGARSERDGFKVDSSISRRWLEALQESPVLFTGLLDGEGRVVEANRLSVEGCGFVRGEILGEFFWNGGWWSPDPSLASKVLGWFERCVSTAEALSAVCRYFRGDGSIGMVELHLVPILDVVIGDQRVGYVVATGLDITELLTAQATREDRLAAEVAAIRLAEQRFRGALDAMIDHVTIARSIRDEAGTIVDFEITFVNEASVDGAGRSSLGMVGHRVCELYPGWKSSGMFDLFLSVVTTGKSFIGDRLAYEDRLSDDTFISGYWDLQVSKLDDGYIAASRDVTAIVQGEDAIRQAKASAEREALAVETLQQAALSVSLPDDAGLTVGVCYQPAVSDAPIGGDWYDVFSLPNNLMVFIIADVAGHGAEAARSMVQLRNLLRTIAAEEPRPDELFRRANRVIATLYGRRIPFTTCCVATLDLGRGELCWSLAGHPPPVIRSETGTRLLESPAGLPLGIAADAHYEASRLEVGPGDRIILYSDGLIEMKGESLDAGFDRLKIGAAASGSMPTQQAAEWLASTISAGDDDVAVVVIDVHVTSTSGV